MKKLKVTVTLIALLVFSSPVMAQDRKDVRKIVGEQIELARPKGWDGKVQGLFRDPISFLHLKGESDYEVLGNSVVEYFNRKSPEGRWTLSKGPHVRTFEKETFLVIKADGREGHRTAFFPVTSQGPQGIIIATNGSICNAGNECGECRPNTMTHTCTCQNEVNPSPLAKCQYGGSIGLSVRTASLGRLEAIAVGTTTRDGGRIKIDEEALLAQVQSIIPSGFKISGTELKTLDREYYSMTSLQNGEGKSYLFITKLENQSGSLLLKHWGFLYHCEGMCGFSIPQCESTSPFTALNGQLSCGCNAHCAPKYGFIARELRTFIDVRAFYP
jgi:hypothetical protein